MLQGERVLLRPVSQADLPLFESWTNDLNFHSEYNFFGLHPIDDVTKKFGESGLLGAVTGTLVIALIDQTIIGNISYHQQRYGPPNASNTYNIGLSIMPAHRAKGYGSEAQRLLAEYLFATYPIERVEAGTDITNVAEQRSLEKAGFTREGVLRRAQWRNGGWHDLVIYSKLRHE